MTSASNPSGEVPAGVPRKRLSSFYFNYYAVIGILVPYLGLYLSDIGLSGEQIGLLVALPTIAKIISPNILSWIAVKIGHSVAVIRVSVFFACFALSGFFIESSFLSVFLTLLVFSFFFNAAMPLFEAVTLEHLEKDSHAYSAIRIWGSIGFIFSVMSVGWAIDQWSVRSFPWYLVLFCFLVLSSALFVTAPPKLLVKNAEAAMRSSLRQPFVICFFVSIFLLQVSHSMYYAFYSLFLEENGFSGSVMGVLWAVGVVAEILLFLKVRPIFERFNIRQCLLFCMFCAVARWILIAQFADAIIVQFFVQALHAFTFGLAHVCAMEFIRQSFVGPRQAQGQALYTAFCWGGGTGLGSILGGFAWGVSPVFVFYGASIFALTAALVIFLFSSASQFDSSH